MARLAALFPSPALSVALAAAALLWFVGGFWPAAARPRWAEALFPSIAVGVAVFALAQALCGPEAA